MLFPDKTCILGDRSLGLKTVHIADFSNDTGRVDLANAGNKSHGSNTNGHSLVYRMICGEGQAIGVLAAAWIALAFAAESAKLRPFSSMQAISSSKSA